VGFGAASKAAQYVVTHPQPSHNPINLDFLLNPLSKSEFLSFAAVEVLCAGAVVGIAPEDTFNHGKLIKAQVGVAYLATQAPASVLPIVMYGQDKAIHCWKSLRRVPVHIRIGTSVPPPCGELNQTLQQRYTDSLMVALACMLPAEYRGVYARMADNIDKSILLDEHHMR